MDQLTYVERQWISVSPTAGRSGRTLMTDENDQLDPSWTRRPTPVRSAAAADISVSAHWPIAAPPLYRRATHDRALVRVNDGIGMHHGR